MAISLKSSLKTIWRLEDPDGFGPFQGNTWFTTTVFENRKDNAMCPVPAKDPKLSEVYNHLLNRGELSQWSFGLSDPLHYDLWFSGVDAEEALQMHGFKVNSYLVEPSFVHEGTNQCMFWRPAALECYDA